MRKIFSIFPALFVLFASTACSSDSITAPEVENKVYIMTISSTNQLSRRPNWASLSAGPTSSINKEKWTLDLDFFLLDENRELQTKSFELRAGETVTVAAHMHGAHSLRQGTAHPKYQFMTSWNTQNWEQGVVTGSSEVSFYMEKYLPYDINPPEVMITDYAMTHSRQEFPFSFDRSEKIRVMWPRHLRQFGCDGNGSWIANSPEDMIATVNNDGLIETTRAKVPDITITCTEYSSSEEIHLSFSKIGI